MQWNRGVSRRFDAGTYRFCFPGAGRSATKKLAATGARWRRIGSLRTAKMEIPVESPWARRDDVRFRLVPRLT